jgi:rare lipoprotein A
MIFRVLCAAAILLCQPPAGHTRSMIASTYGYEGGRTTASGKRFKPSGITVAHRHLPFGTCLVVSHHGREVRAIVNDRGPFRRGREIDLSLGAARAIGFSGVGRVDVEPCGEQAAL